MAGKVLPFLVCLAVALADFVLSKPPGVLQGSDEVYYFIYLPSLIVDGDLDFANEIEWFRQVRVDGAFDNPPISDVGRVINRYGVGYALLSFPFFLLGFPATLMARAAGRTWDYDGMNPLFQFSTTLASVTWGFVGLALCRRVLERHFGAPAAGRAVALVFWATPLVYYMCFSPAMAHACAFFSVALWFYVWDRRPPDLPLSRAVALGAAGTLAFLVRYANILIWLGAAVDFLRWRAERPPGMALGRWLWFWLIAALTFVVGVAPQFWIWHEMFGRALVNPYRRADLFAHYLDPRFAELLFADAGGLLNWHPIFGFALVGLGVSLFRRRWLACHALAVVAGLLYLYASYAIPLGESFGSRGFVDALPFFGVGLAAFAAPGRGGAVRWGLCVALIFVNLAAAAAYRFRASNRAEPYSWRERLERAAEAPAEAQRRAREVLLNYRLD
ncbi:MAG TPA: hypothetical protein VNL14_07935 [Candidatus Acidoferrales bacterium]|nr:hypothetical protein [Candidatus Acidoferrales bacterium]